MKTKLSIYLDLFWTFLKIGGFTLGGGYAMLPIIQHEAVENKKWVTAERMSDFMTLAQSSPGIIGINAATAIGYETGGFWGGFFAAVGMIISPLIVIIIIAMAFNNFADEPVVQSSFKGVRAAVIALVAYAGLKLVKTNIRHKTQWIIALAAGALIAGAGVSPQYIILGSIALGLVIGVFRKMKEGSGDDKTS